MLGFGALVEAQATAVGDIADLGQVAVEARGVSETQGIDARGDEVLFVFEGMKRGLEVSEGGGDTALSIDGEVLRRCAGKEDGHGIYDLRFGAVVVIYAYECAGEGEGLAVGG